MDTEYWNAARQAVLKAMAMTDPDGLRRAIERRAVVTWRREASARIDPAAVDLPWKAVESIKLDFRLIQESDVVAAEFYQQAGAWIANGTLRIH